MSKIAPPDRAPLARWNKQGKFVRPDGSSFVPLGGIYGNFISVDWAGIPEGSSRISAHSKQQGNRIVEFQDATDEQLREWLRYMRREGMNFMRCFNRGDMRNGQDPLDVGGKVNRPLWEKFKHYFDIAYEEGIAVHFVILQEPRCSVYMNKNVTQTWALPQYSEAELAKLPPHRRRFVDLNNPRVGYDTYFSDADVLQCHKDYLDDLAPLLKDHPALLAIELYNEQQWGDHFYWESHDQEVAWSAELIKHIHAKFPGIPATCSFAGFGIAAQDPLLWTDGVPMDFFSPHIYQALGGLPPRTDFAGMFDVVLNYSQPERPTMMGECSPGKYGGREFEERIVLRDLAWFSVLNNCPGFGMWMVRGFGEFDLVKKVMESVDFANFKPSLPPVIVNIKPHVEFFQALEKNPSKECKLQEDIWCPHRGQETDHRYCVKMNSPQLQELYDWSQAALRRGIRYQFTRHPEKYPKTWLPSQIGTHRLAEVNRPFLPNDAYQTKYLSSEDDKTHIVYLRNYTLLKVGSDVGRTKNRPSFAELIVALEGDGQYEVDIWNLDTKVKWTRTCGAKDKIGLGNTNDDFVLVFRRK